MTLLAFLTGPLSRCHDDAQHQMSLLVLVAGCLACSPRDPSMLREIAPIIDVAFSAVDRADLEEQQPPTDPGERLPAGLYFRHVFSSCADCPTPGAVVIAHILATPDEAERQLAHTASPREGYPFAAHTDELGINDDTERGIAIVTGLFATTESARNGIARGEAEGAAFALLDDLRVSRGSSQMQVIAVGDRSTPAFTTPTSTETSCIVPPNRLFLLSSDVLSSPPSTARLPVTCDDDAIGYVDITSTLYFTTTFPAEGEGRPRLRQSIDVACDTATIHEWHLRGASRTGDGTEIQSCP